MWTNKYNANINEKASNSYTPDINAQRAVNISQPKVTKDIALMLHLIVKPILDNQPHHA